VSELDDFSRNFTLIRSKCAGPFMLTIDLMFASSDARERLVASGLISPSAIGEIYGVDPASVLFFDIPDIDAVKISFPRPIPSSDFGDRDVAGGQQYALLIDALVGQFR
jgi:hypothetical protein